MRGVILLIDIQIRELVVFINSKFIIEGKKGVKKIYLIFISKFYLCYNFKCLFRKS